MPAFDAIDVDGLTHFICGDKTVLEDIFDIFRDYYPEQLTIIREAIDTGNSNALRESAHKLKGSLSMFHATPAVATANSLEAAGFTGKLSETDRLYVQLETDINTLCDQVGQLIASF